VSFLDNAATLDPSTTPWAPKVALAAAPTAQPPAPTPVAPPAPIPPALPAQPAQPAASGAKITPETHPHFYEAAKPEAKEPTESGSDYFSTVRRRESGGNDLAWNGTAAGRYQFTPQTWLGVAAAHPELGLRPEDIWNGEKQEIAMRAHTADNARVLQENGLPADPGNLYMMHFLGTGGGPKFLKAMQANPSADAEAMFPLEAKYNSPIFFEKDGHPRTLGQIYGLMTKDFGGQAPPSATSETELQAPQHAALPLIEGRAADVEPELPPPPPGVTLKPLQQTVEQKLPPPPPGVTLKPLTTQDAYEQDLGKTPYEAEAARTEGKPAQPPMPNATQPGQVDEFGRPSNLPPAQQQDFGKGETEMLKGVASGVGQSATGVGELVPGPIGDKSAEATKYLQGVGTTFGQGVGELAGQAAPALMGIGAVGSGARAIAEEGPSMARILSTAGKGAASGGAMGAMTPTGETDTGARLADKAESAAIGAAAGGALGGATPAIGAVLKKASEIPSLFKSAFGKDAEKAAEELRQGVNAETGKALTEEEKAAKIAQIEKGVEKVKAAKEESATTAQEKKASDAEIAKQAVIEKHAAKPTKPPESVGDEIHQTAVADMDALKKERTEKSGFDKAVRSDGGKPSIPTEKFIADSNKILATSKSKELRDAVLDFKKELTNAPSVKGQPAEKAVSIKQAREILESMNERIENLPPGPAHELTTIKNDFMKHLEATHPQMKAAREAYARLSRPLDVYERTGALKKAVMEDPYSGKSIMDSTKIKAAVTNKTEAGADALGRLIEKNPALRDSVRQTYQHQLFGSGAAAKTPTPNQLRSFLESNRLGLEKSGLYKEFAEMKTERDAAESLAKTEGDKAKEMRSVSGTETQKNIKSLAVKKAQSEAGRRDFKQFQSSIETLPAKNVATAASSAVEKLHTKGYLTDGQLDKFNKQIQDVNKKYGDSEEAKKQLWKILIISGGVGGALGLVGGEGVPLIRHTLPMH
jgi:hypothetical protein